MEVSDVRRRLRGAIEQAKRRAAERRTRVDQASRDYEQFLSAVAVPAMHTIAQALIGEGHRFKVLTPGQAARLAAEFSPDNYLEISLDTDGDVPAVMVHTSRGRGRRSVARERALDGPISELTEEDLVTDLLEELIPLIER
jgi:DNA-binding transcriptional ArsR family regulator